MFDIAFAVSYGLSRMQLEELNHRIESSGAYENYLPEVRTIAQSSSPLITHTYVLD